VKKLAQYLRSISINQVVKSNLQMTSTAVIKDFTPHRKIQNDEPNYRELLEDLPVLFIPVILMIDFSVQSGSCQLWGRSLNWERICGVVPGKFLKQMFLFAS